ncbi:MAG: RNA repair domain-containing protein [Candidatus Hydrothermarchaeales archaeon]
MAKKKLLELKWHPQKSLEDVEVTYLHRGAPEDKLTVQAQEIVDLEKSFFVLMRRGEEVRIPYHRILELRKEGEIIWKKKR